MEPDGRRAGGVNARHSSGTGVVDLRLWQRGELIVGQGVQVTGRLAEREGHGREQLAGPHPGPATGRDIVACTPWAMSPTSESVAGGSGHRSIGQASVASVVSTAKRTACVVG
jgi:hypothetical protein